MGDGIQQCHSVALEEMNFTKRTHLPLSLYDMRSQCAKLSYNGNILASRCNRCAIATRMRAHFLTDLRVNAPHDPAIDHTPYAFAIDSVGSQSVNVVPLPGSLCR